MNNRIPFSNLIVILELNRKETKDQFFQEKNFLLQRKEFKQAIDSIRERKNINYKYFNNLIQEYKKEPYHDHNGTTRRITKKRLKKIRDYVEKRLNLDDIAHIRRICKLSSAWEHPIIKYVLTNRMSKPNFSPKVKLVDAPYRHDRKLLIEIYGNNSWRDVKKIWKSLVEPRLNFLPDYRIKGERYKPHLNSHMLIAKWRQQGIRGEELAEKVRKKLRWGNFNSESLRKIVERVQKLKTKKKIA